jgi:hypothetical protein
MFASLTIKVAPKALLMFASLTIKVAGPADTQICAVFLFLKMDTEKD